MSRPVVVTVGGLATAGATKIGLSQSPGAAGALVLNGALGTFTANNVALSQTTAGAAALALNGALAQGTPAVAYPGGPIYITSLGNDSGITFAIVGTNTNGAVISETLTGTNTSVVASSNSYYEITSITTSGATSASGVTVGTFAAVTLDKPRAILFTSSGTDTGINITTKGTDASGDAITETFAGGSSGSPVSTKLSYLTLSQAKVSGATAGTIEVGTNTVARSPWVAFDPYYLPQVAIQCDVTGTVNYSIQTTMDDPNSPTNPVTPAAVVWINSPDAAAVGATGSIATSLAYAPFWATVLLNSGSGTVTATFAQLGYRP